MSSTFEETVELALRDAADRVSKAPAIVQVSSTDILRGLVPEQLSHSTSSAPPTLFGIPIQIVDWMPDREVIFAQERSGKWRAVVSITLPPD